MKRVLMVAYHFPPMAGSSGIQRTLRFVQQLPAHGWQALVVSAHPSVYLRTSADLLAEVPAQTVVRRALALDTARHLAIAGRHLGALARPDRWMTWRFDAVRQGMQLVQQFAPDALWSTYPIATAHVIGAELHRRTGLPWIADFRDPMAQPGYPEDPKVWASYRAIEGQAAQHAARCCFTTPSAAATYRARYPEAADRMVVLENGYDEDSFATAESSLAAREPLNPGLLTLLHSGTVYPSERDPTQLFQALAALHAARPPLAQRLRLRFRAAGNDALLVTLAQRFGITDLIEVLPPIAYGEALAEMLRADGLLVLQASNCNEQVPAKIYEYLRSRRPIVCLSDPDGDTCAVLQRAGVTRDARLDDAAGIGALLASFAAGDMTGMTGQPQAIASTSRAARAAELARLLDDAVAPQRAASASVA